MRNTNAPSTAGQLRLETHPEFNVVLAYDEYAGGIRAKDFFDTLALDHGELFQFISHLWKFEVLREPLLFDVAARDAARADMIVLAILQSQERPVGPTLGQLTESANVQVFCKEIDWPAMDSHFPVKITKPQLREEPWRYAPEPSPYAGQP
ncbi:MAG TPA: hypothetical protein VG324_26230, partial [Blastocatellia bacterium]|nr:hypothetical protein [Blastocatellia bacterium]